MAEAANEASRNSWSTLANFHMARALCPANLEFEFRKKSLEQALNAVHRVIACELPWLEVGEGKQTADDSTYRRMYDRWKQIWGDPKDPAVAEQIRKTGEYLRRTAGRPRR